MKLLLAAWFTLSAMHGADVIVAAASDLAPLAPNLEGAFEKFSGVKVRFTLASSGSLARQIEQGAPFDVFLSANDQYVRELASSGYVDPASVRIYAQGRVALWSRNGAVHSLEDLSKPAVKHVAIPNPEHAPYGVAARNALENRGVWKDVQPKIVYAENVRQALQFAQSGNADAVITSWTLLLGRGMLLPAAWHAPIRQAAGVVQSSSKKIEAGKFVGFLMSPQGRKILESGGLFAP